MNIKMFYLDHHKATANVRFLYPNISDYKELPIHYVRQDNGGWTCVNCTGSDCSHCAKGLVPTYKVFVPLYDETDKCVKFWDRSHTVMPWLADLYRQHPDLTNTIFQIVRYGEKGNPCTRYHILTAGTTPEPISVGKLPNSIEVFNYVYPAAKPT